VIPPDPAAGQDPGEDDPWYSSSGTASGPPTVPSPPRRRDAAGPLPQ
jgi:hypothetical protein